MPQPIPLHQQLLMQAQGLAQQDPKKPYQANLRRAVSSGYYALFHLLIHTSTRELLGARTDVDGVRNALARAYTHSDMIEASKKFA